MSQKRYPSSGPAPINGPRPHPDTSRTTRFQKPSNTSSSSSSCSSASSAGSRTPNPVATRFHRWPIGLPIDESVFSNKLLFGPKQRELVSRYLEPLGYKGYGDTGKPWVWKSSHFKTNKPVFIRPISKQEVYILRKLNRKSIRQRGDNHTAVLDKIVKCNIEESKGKKESYTMGIFADAGRPAHIYEFKTADSYYQVLLQIFESLVFTHEQGIVYRDVHGWNTIISDTRQGPKVTLIDWENARLVKMPGSEVPKHRVFAQEPFLEDIRALGELCLGGQSIFAVMFGFPLKAIKAYTTTRMAGLFKLMAASTQKDGGITMANALELFRQVVEEASSGRSRLYYVQ